MLFRVEFSTYNAELIAVLQKLKGKKPYLVEKALTHFLASQTGKEIVNALISKTEGRAVKKLMAKKDKTAPLKEKKILIDKFL